VYELVWHEAGFGWHDISEVVLKYRQKYNLRQMEQLRVNSDRGQYDVTIVKFWHQTLGNSFNHRIFGGFGSTSLMPLLGPVLC